MTPVLVENHAVVRSRLMPGPETLARRFELLEAAGAGGMGTIYRAHDRQTGQTVAAKLLAADDEIDVDRFAREADVLGTLSHPGIVRYITHGIDGDRRYLIMDWIDGVNLHAKITQEGLTLRESITIAQQVAEALAEAHRHGVIHRDVKPENIMLAGDDLSRVRVVDFGLARFVADIHKLTRTGLAMGTPGYMSPEQARGSRVLDGRADVFALGCVLYESIAGVPPFRGENVMALQIKVLMLDPVPLHELWADIPMPISAIVSLMLAKSLDERPAMDAVARGLAALEVPDGLRRGSSPPPAETRKIGAISREPAPWVVLASPRRPSADWPDRARAAAAVWRHDLTRDNVLAVRHADATSAARCAVLLATTLADATLVVSAPALAAPSLDETVERSTQVMSVAALRGIFARGANAARIYLDATTASLLGGTFDVVPDADMFVLRGEK